MKSKLKLNRKFLASRRGTIRYVNTNFVFPNSLAIFIKNRFDRIAIGFNFQDHKINSEDHVRQKTLISTKEKAFLLSYQRTLN